MTTTKLPKMKKDKKYVIGIDLGGTTIMGAVLGQKCKIIKQISRPTQAALGEEKVIGNIREEITELVNLCGIKASSLTGIGLGFPGFVDSKEGVIRHSPNLPGWKDVPVARILKEEFNLPVFLDHDVNLFTLAEKHYGVGKGKNHILGLTIGTGIGMGLIFNDEIYCGADIGAGNLGHMIIDENGPRCPCGNKGCLEMLAAGPAICAKAAKLIKQGAKTSLAELIEGDIENLEAKLVFQAAQAGDDVARQIVNETAWILGIGIGNVISLLNPEIVIIGGGVALAGDLLFIPLIESVRVHSYTFRDKEIDIVPARLGSDAGMVGAAHLVWESVKDTMTRKERVYAAQE